MNLAALSLVLPLLASAAMGNENAVRLVLAKIIVGDSLPEAIFSNAKDPKFPPVDQEVAKAKGCKVTVLDSLQNGSYGVQWKCKGRKMKDQPSAMIFDVKDGQVIRITTASLQ